MGTDSGLFDALRDASATRLSIHARDGVFRALASRDDGPWEPVSLVLSNDCTPAWEAVIDALVASGCESLDLVHLPSVGAQLVLVRHRRVEGSSFGLLRRVEFATPEGDVIKTSLQLARVATQGLVTAGGVSAGCHVAIYGPAPSALVRDAYARVVVEELGLAGFTVVPDSGIDLLFASSLGAAGASVQGTDGLFVQSAVIGINEAIHAMDATLGLLPSESTIGLVGLGAVGMPLARRLVSEGRTLAVSDRDLRRLDGLVDAIPPDARSKVTTVAPYQAAEIVCDLLVLACPAGSFKFEDLLRLRCRGILGVCEAPVIAIGADGDAHYFDALHERGILAAPWGFATTGAFSILSLYASGATPSAAAVTARTMRVARQELGVLLDTCRRAGKAPWRAQSRKPL